MDDRIHAELLLVHRDEPVRVRIDPMVRLAFVSKSIPRIKPVTAQSS